MSTNDDVPLLETTATTMRETQRIITYATNQLHSTASREIAIALGAILGKSLHSRQIRFISEVDNCRVEIEMRGGKLLCITEYEDYVYSRPTPTSPETPVYNSYQGGLKFDLRIMHMEWYEQLSNLIVQFVELFGGATPSFEVTISV